MSLGTPENSAIQKLSIVIIIIIICFGSDPVNLPDPIRIRSGSAPKLLPEAGRVIIAHRLVSGPDPSGPNLTQSARTQSDPGWFCTIIMIQAVCGRTQPSLKVGNWKWAGCVLPETDPMIFAHRLASGPDTFLAKT